MKVALVGAFGNLGFEILKKLSLTEHELVALDLKEKDLGLQRVGQSLAVEHHLMLVSLELGLQSLAEANGLTRDDMLQRAALNAGEDGLVDLLGDLLVVAEDQTAAGAAEGLVGGGGHHVGVGYGAHVQTRRHQAGDVGHIHHQIGTHLVARASTVTV